MSAQFLVVPLYRCAGDVTLTVGVYFAEPEAMLVSLPDLLPPFRTFASISSPGRYRHAAASNRHLSKEAVLRLASAGIETCQSQTALPDKARRQYVNEPFPRWARFRWFG